MDKPLLTVFTPTYNRAHTITRTYESLCRQTNKDFEWLVVDDGSNDNTEQLVRDWISEGKIPIRYVHKENGGLHTGYNTAFALINTILNVCIDSDDYMPDDGVEIISEVWQSIKDKSDLAGFIGLDFTLENEPIGGNFSKVGDFHIYEMAKFHTGDTKIVCRTELLKRIAPMPVFEGEKNFNPIYFYIQIDKDFKFRLVNKNLCFVDYQPTGMSANILRQYQNSPRSFAQLRRLYMSMPYYSNLKHFRNAIHYVSSCLFSKQWNGLRTNPRPILCLLAIPFGICLFLYIKIKNHRYYVKG